MSTCQHCWRQCKMHFCFIFKIFVFQGVHSKIFGFIFGFILWSFFCQTSKMIQKWSQKWAKNYSKMATVNNPISLWKWTPWGRELIQWRILLCTCWEGLSYWWAFYPVIVRLAIYSGSKNCPNVFLLYEDTCITQCWHNIKIWLNHT